MTKKIVGLIIIIVLFFGSICGVVYGVKYTNYESDKEIVIEQQQDTISTLEKQLQQLAEEKQKIIADNLISAEEKNQRIEEFEAKNTELKTEIEYLKSVYGVDETADGYTLTIVPFDNSEEKGHITFSVDKIVLNNIHRAQTFTYTIEEGYPLTECIAVADGLFGFNYYENLVVVWLLEDLTETIVYDYCISFFTD